VKISLSFYVFSLSLQILYGQHGKELSEIYLHLGIDYIDGLVIEPNIIVNNNEIYIATIDGQIIKLNATLDQVAKKKNKIKKL
jgi:hypothetical protein